MYRGRSVLRVVLPAIIAASTAVIGGCGGGSGYEQTTITGAVYTYTRDKLSTPGVITLQDLHVAGPGIPVHVLESYYFDGFFEYSESTYYQNHNFSERTDEIYNAHEAVGLLDQAGILAQSQDDSQPIVVATTDSDRDTCGLPTLSPGS